MSQNWHVRKRQDAPGAIRLRQLLLCSSSAASSESVVECCGKGEDRCGYIWKQQPPNRRGIFSRLKAAAAAGDGGHRAALKMTESQRLVYVFRQVGLFNIDPTQS